MKSSTQYQSNVQALSADKRFEILVKRQMTEHEHLIANHNKEMQDMRDALKLALEKFEALWFKYADELKDFKLETSTHFHALKNKLQSQEVTIDDQKKKIEYLHAQLHNFHEVYFSKSDAEGQKKDLDAQVKEATISHLVCIQELQRELKLMFNLLKEDFLKSKYEIETKFSEHSERIDRNFNTNKIDREGVLKEVRVYEKTIFIIEKKIENIYTLIERIKGKNEPS